jgi:transcriptional regulator with XRE-family HTH domain
VKSILLRDKLSRLSADRLSRIKYVPYGKQHVVEKGQTVESLADYVRRIRNDKNLSLADVSRRAGFEIKRSHISRIENGEVKNVGVEKLKALARGLEVHFSEVLGVASGSPIELDPHRREVRRPITLKAHTWEFIEEFSDRRGVSVDVIADRILLTYKGVVKDSVSRLQRELEQLVLTQGAGVEWARSVRRNMDELNLRLPHSMTVAILERRFALAQVKTDTQKEMKRILVTDPGAVEFPTSDEYFEILKRWRTTSMLELAGIFDLVAFENGYRLQRRHYTSEDHAGSESPPTILEVAAQLASVGPFEFPDDVFEGDTLTQEDEHRSEESSWTSENPERVEQDKAPTALIEDEDENRTS